MKKSFLIGSIAAVLVVLPLTSCNEEADKFDDHGSATIVSLTGTEKAYMGDSIRFDFVVASSGVQINQAKVQLYYGNDMVSESFYSLKGDGAYSGSVLAPYLKDAEDGDARVVVRIQNERFSTDSKEMVFPVKRPTYKTLTLTAEDGTEYTMYPSASDPYTFVAHEAFPALWNAKISAPAFSDGTGNEYLKGNPLNFGLENGKIAINGSEGIKIDNESVGYDKDGKYDVTFDTRTFACSPLYKFGVEFHSTGNIEGFEVSGNNMSVTAQFVKDEIITLHGLGDLYPTLWKNPSYFDEVEGEPRLLHFRGRTGKYTLTVNKSLAALQMVQTEGTSANGHVNASVMWLVGNNQIGFPSYSKNQINWNTGRAFALCPIDTYKYELVMLVGTNIGSVSFKMYTNKNWGGEWRLPGDYKIVEGAEYVAAASDGNFNKGGKWPETGKYIVYTFDTSTNPTSLWVKEYDTMPLYKR